MVQGQSVLVDRDEEAAGCRLMDQIPCGRRNMSPRMQLSEIWQHRAIVGTMTQHIEQIVFSLWLIFEGGRNRLVHWERRC